MLSGRSPLSSLMHWSIISAFICSNASSLSPLSSPLLSIPCRPYDRRYNNPRKKHFGLKEKKNSNQEEFLQPSDIHNRNDNGIVIASPIQQAMRQERRQRQNGLLAGGCLTLMASSVGIIFGFLNPTILFMVSVMLIYISASVTESFNEYDSPMDDSFFRVQESTIPDAGNGLFADRFIPKGTFLMEYKGERLTETEYFNRYPEGDGRYVAQVDYHPSIANGILYCLFYFGQLLWLYGNKWQGGEENTCSTIGKREEEEDPVIYIDGRDSTKSGLARYMNSDSKNPNVAWKKQRYGKQAGRMYFYTIQDASPGDELLFDYGNDYWQAVVTTATRSN